MNEKLGELFNEVMVRMVLNKELNERRDGMMEVLWKNYAFMVAISFHHLEGEADRLVTRLVTRLAPLSAPIDRVPPPCSPLKANPQVNSLP